MVSSFTGAGDTADADPYGGHTVEWTTSSPAPSGNFVHVPTVRSAEPRLDQIQEGSRS
jgi:heme/copper-type cytochrome/quinol oxidase subunit 1